MLHNVGKIDRIVRLSVGLALVVLYYLKVGNGQFGDYFIFGAALLFISSMRQCCPIYALLGFGTCGTQTNVKDQVVKPKKIDLRK
mgnify:CR=1 FL=1|jgi:hypothetical protein